MGHAPLRNMNAELREGATDGGYKKLTRNRGGQVESTTSAARASLQDWWYGYGIIEAPDKRLPDGRWA